MTMMMMRDREVVRLVLFTLALLSCAFNLEFVKNVPQQQVHAEPPSQLVLISATSTSVIAADEDGDARRQLLLSLDETITSSSSSSLITTETTPQSTTSSSSPSLTIDILSIGSNTRPYYQQSQRETAGQHPTVRHFLSFTEHNDTRHHHHPPCHAHLTLEQVHSVRHYCSRSIKAGYPLVTFFNRLFASPQYLEKKGDPAGWLCAQKRPVDALQQVIAHYRQEQEQANATNGTTSTALQQVLPDFLFVVDDDTYLNMPAVVDHLKTMMIMGQSQQQQSPPALMVAGCLSRTRFMNFSFPYGGWGTFISRHALQRWMHPLYCGTEHKNSLDGNSSSAQTTSGDRPDDNDSLSLFRQHACERIQENLIGERHVFRNGMSISDVMYAYTMNQSYFDVDQWQQNNKKNDKNKNGDGAAASLMPGFCFHSDTALAYFAAWYRIAQHARRTTTSMAGGGGGGGGGDAPSLHHKRWNYDQDRWIGYKGSTRFVGQQMPGARKTKRECNYRNDTLCTTESELCHYVKPERVKELYAYHQRQQDEQHTAKNVS